MSTSLFQRLFDELDALWLVDPHTHINPQVPAARSLADILGYHYYTELVHAAGVPRSEIENPQLSPRDKVRRLAAGLSPLENTAQHQWLLEILRQFFGFEHARLTADNADEAYDLVERKTRASDWPAEVLRQSRLRAVFLTNDFDDPLAGFDTSIYVPCLRTDELVFHLARPAVRERLAKSSGVEVKDLASLRRALAARFEHFRARGARACAISLPPDFVASHVPTEEAERELGRLLTQGDVVDPETRARVSQLVFWTLAEHCAEFGLPFDLMIGVNRAVYPGGVFQGQDLYDSRVSLIQYRELFNAFPQVTFPISVLASVTNQELVSYAWIFPNVVTCGHWWYSNTPSLIERDLAHRLEAAPLTKQIGYYSDMYKLEFAWPKFRMYKRVLAKVLAERFVVDRGWSEERALELGRTLLVDNVSRIFGEPGAT
ncbi:MAG: glucuronate isomerase [Pirellulales bacterium]